MALRLEDFQLTPEMRRRCAGLLEQWDARDPWRPSAALESQVMGLVTEVCAPRVVLMASPVHAAKFLRELMEQSNASPRLNQAFGIFFGFISETIVKAVRSVFTAS